MPEFVIVTVAPIVADTLEEAEKIVLSHETLMEEPGHVYGAASLDELPHPSQVAAVAERFPS